MGKAIQHDEQAGAERLPMIANLRRGAGVDRSGDARMDDVRRRSRHDASAASDSPEEGIFLWRTTASAVAMPSRLRMHGKPPIEVGTLIWSPDENAGDLH
jgi:hypothetical protein